MRYLLVVYSETDPASPHGRIDIAEESMACERSLRDSGRLLVRETLHPAETATTVRLRQGRILLADGPSTVHSGRITGICVISARDYSEAVRIAAQLPAARLGWVEVRAVRVSTPEPAPSETPPD